MANTLHALLIGVNHYFPTRIPAGVNYRSLQGCVRDVAQVEALLKRQVGLEEQHLIKLTATAGADAQPIEPANRLPTYPNIISGFETILGRAHAGDQVVIHYSGHGGRTDSIYPEEMRPSRIDEALVPTDVGLEEGRYLRDLELAYWLSQFASAELFATVILDCCHSGGLTRGDAVPRGGDSIDRAARPTPIDHHVVENWQALGGRTAGWLPSHPNWVVLSACRPQEKAFEQKFDRSNTMGALTYSLIETLNSGIETLNYTQLHRQVLARVQSRFSRQRPQLYGNGSRQLFGTSTLKRQFSVPVLKVDQAAERVTLNGGIAQGIQEGDRFAIFPASARALDDFSKVVAEATVSKARAATSACQLSEGFREISPGAQAVLVQPADIRLKGLVRVLSAELRPLLRSAHDATPFRQFIEWAGDRDAADYLVELDSSGTIAIRDETDQPIPGLTPISIEHRKAAQIIVDRLIHLTRYRNVWELMNVDSREKGVPQVALEWEGVSADPTFTAGEWARLRIRNDSDRDIEMVLLQLDSDWSVKQVYPLPPEESYTFAPSEEDILEIKTMHQRGGNEESVTHFKLFATRGGTNFRMLELPGIDQALTRQPSMVRNRLEALLSTLVEANPATRSASTAARQWTTRQVTLRVKKG